MFLDELLWSILVTSRSLSTERLKGGLLKLLPNSLGKEAILEAEVELRAYKERNGSTSSVTAGHGGAEDANFPLQSAFEVQSALFHVIIRHVCTRHWFFL